MRAAGSRQPTESVPSESTVDSLLRCAQTGLSDVVVMRAADGLQRRVVAANGGWPAFGPDGRLFFHRLAPDGW